MTGPSLESPWPSAVFLHGLALLEDGKAADAIGAFTAALAECDGTQQSERIAECLYGIGAAHAESEQVEQATDAYARAADLLAEGPLTELSVECAEMAGRGFDVLEQPERAVPYLRRAATGLECFGDLEEQADCDAILGSALADTGQFHEAMIVWRRAAERYLAVDRIVEAAECRESCGEAAMEIEDAHRVRDEHRIARELYERAGELSRTGACSYAIGLACRELGETATAEREFVRAKASATVEGNAAGAANCDEELAELYLADGRKEDAAAAFSAAGAGYAAAGKHLQAGQSRFRAGELHLRAGRLRAAILEFTGVRAQWVAADEPGLAAAAEVMSGMVLQNCGDYEDATAAYRRAREHHTAAGELLDVAECDMHLATVRISMGDFAEATELLQHATAVFENHRDDPRYAQCLLNTGVVQGHRGRIPEARRLFAQARRYADSEELLRSCLMEESRLIVHGGGDFTAALTMLDEARAGAEQAQEWALAAQCLEFSGLCRYHLSHYAAAEDLLIRAREAYVLLGLRTEIATADLHLGLVYYQTGRSVEAEEVLERGRAGLREFENHPYTANTETLIGGLHMRAGRYRQAADAFRTAAAELTRSGLLFQAAVARLSLGGALIMQGDHRIGAELTESVLTVFDADPANRRYHAVGLLNLGCAELISGHYDAALARARAARQVTLDIGDVVTAAKCDLIGAAAAAESGDVRAALEQGLPAAVFVDAQRFGFASATARISWREMNAVLLAGIFHWAYQLGDTTLLADLIETTINSGTHVAEHPSADDGGDLQTTLAALAVSGTDMSDTTIDENLAASGISGAAALISGAILPMRPPPRLRMPDGHVALAPYLAAADAAYAPIERPGEVAVW
ncbi:tetratricopeptide repeat protein [Nocardia brasiliensis]|uniref:tetratricopeptide repeat protein n=1 Tax=Nocardia brasiliensis TaxID=37326 RepID=UPI0037BDF8E6